MVDFPLEELLPRANGSMYKLVRMAAQRALELSDGKPPLIPKPASDKVTTIALEEILRGKVQSKEAVEKMAHQKKSGEKAKHNEKESEKLE